MIMTVVRTFHESYGIQGVLYDNGLTELGSHLENSIKLAKFPSPKFTISLTSTFQSR
jgi:hypothetical protein